MTAHIFGSTAMLLPEKKANRYQDSQEKTQWGPRFFDFADKKNLRNSA